MKFGSEKEFQTMKGLKYNLKRVEPRRKRKGWDSYFMKIAEVVASRSTCDRKMVGAVIVKDKRILSTGYNGSISGMPHCDEVGHVIESGHCIATVHAEANALIQAAKNGVSIDGATMYVTVSPCWNCFKMIANCGIRRVVFKDLYDDRMVFETAMKVGILLEQITADRDPD